MCMRIINLPFPQEIGRRKYACRKLSLIFTWMLNGVWMMMMLVVVMWWWGTVHLIFGSPEISQIKTFGFAVD